MPLRCVVHCHTEYSRDSLWKIADVITQCQAEKIDVIAVTDHDTIAGALALRAVAPANLQVIIGQEISTAQGDLVALYLQTKIEPHQTIQATMAEIHRQGGLVVLPHPFDRVRRKSVGAQVSAQVAGELDLIETFNARCVLSQDNVTAQHFAQTNHLTSIAAADAHCAAELGNVICLLDNTATATDFVQSLRQAKFNTRKASLGVHVYSAWAKLQHHKYVVQLKKYLPWLNVLATGVICAIYLQLAFSLAGGSVATSTVNWMNIHHVTDFTNWQEIIAFFKNLRTGITPLLSFLEILDYYLVGNQNLVLIKLYHFSLIGSFLLAIIFGSRSVLGRIVSCVVSLIFLQATVLIHPFNPQLYDIVYPFCILLYIGALSCLRKVHSAWLLGGLSFVAGFAATAMELSRPFALLLLPFMIIGAYYWLRLKPKRYFFLFLIPVIIFSGGWHSKLLIFNNGQVLWSNHSGYNLSRAWDHLPDLIMPSGVDESASAVPLAPDRWINLDTYEHSINNDLTKKTIVRYMVTHPLNTIVTIDQHLLVFVTPITTIYGNGPNNVPPMYPALVHLSFLVVFGGLITLLYICYKQRSIVLIFEPINAWIILTCSTIFLLVVGEAGEEARFLISVLPLLAGLPMVLDKNR